MILRHDLRDHCMFDFGSSLQDSQARVCPISHVIGAEPAQLVGVPNGGVARRHKFI